MQRSWMGAVAGLLIGIPLSGQQPGPALDDSVAAAHRCGACIDGLRQGLVPLADTGRHLAVEHSDAYYTRLQIHRIGTYVILPMFVAEYFLGEKVLNDERQSTGVGRAGSSVKGLHSAVAVGMGVVFSVNTVTGVWNLIESRHDRDGGTRRWVHALSMLVADAGFVATAAAATNAQRNPSGADHHRALAIGSMSLATASSVMMWLWKN